MLERLDKEVYYIVNQSDYLSPYYYTELKGAGMGNTPEA